jgi:hypothetical protein
LVRAVESTHSPRWRRSLAYYESVVNFLRVHATITRLEVTPYRLDGTVIDRGRVTLTPRPM